jgi:hypothetical protein
MGLCGSTILDIPDFNRLVEKSMTYKITIDTNCNKVLIRELVRAGYNIKTKGSKSDVSYHHVVANNNPISVSDYTIIPPDRAKAIFLNNEVEHLVSRFGYCETLIRFNKEDYIVLDEILARLPSSIQAKRRDDGIVVWKPVKTAYTIK